MRWRNNYIALLCMGFITPLVQADESLLLTGVVSSSNSQVVTAPRTDRWQVQIQWLADEGKIVNVGDLVAVFDGGGIQSQLEQNEENLNTQKLQLIKTEMDLNQAVVEAEGALKLATIMVEKTRIEASIPDGEVSDYEKGKYRIAYERAIADKVKAEEKVKLKRAERDIGINKQQLELIKLQESIDYQKSQLGKLSVEAQVRGPVTHMLHPWNGEKIAAGTNVQASWNIVSVQAEQGYQVTAWIHEIDAVKLNAKNSQIILSLDAYPNETYQGHIVSQSRQAEQKPQWSDSAYYQLDIAFDQLPKHDIFPGMSVRVQIQQNGGQHDAQ
ncbi:HlyD family secretion protein [Neptunicella marina]|uniref:HlyD family efflux transporter periplasmic adaptor subunit n=1 Tax=Neptunicella marina TaxID=2125989 RepID=A0A8J6IWJ7_9ALTE|nr:HlyD family efflux transporter periplasmic adaptor subunit [Neptunicella marina]MBC3767374.1 HlyD family efflux transporter periplasmic adaptor subunit [Neptunicella marina]